MLLTMAISLYASRLILDVLGIEDFGIYNIVGGVVMMLAFMNNVMAVSVSRFMGLAIGEGNEDRVRNVFIASTNLHFCLAILIALFAELFGIWYIPNYLNVPMDRYQAAYIVFHLSILAMMLNVIRVPFIASVTINEDMNVFALFSIIESVLKLLIIFLLTTSGIDKLVTYGIYMLIVTAFMTIIYIVYCRRNYYWCIFKVLWEKGIYGEILKFAGFNTFGNMVGLIVENGQNILLNLFFGPAVNAARGIAFQVNNALKGFVGNIFAAVNPQIFKSYGEGNKTYVKKLLYNSTRLSFCLMLLFCLPIILNIDYILSIWLKKVPEYSNIFVVLILINSIVYANTQPLLIAIHATGKIGKLHFFTGLVNSLNLIVSYILLKCGNPPQTVFFVQIIVSIAMIGVILIVMKYTLGIGIVEYLRNVYINELYMLILAIPLPLYLFFVFKQGLWCLLTLIVVSSFCVLLCSYFFGVEKVYRDKILHNIIRRHDK